jgi:2-polyprenyl-6-methoxyphenol hydroxylase-like FAD-dependent oxidoreductase
MPIRNRTGRHLFTSLFSSTVDQQIVIAGAGIAGLTAAVALQQLGRRPKVFDPFPSVPTTGNYVNLHRDTVDRLARLGIDKSRVLGNTNPIAMSRQLVPASRARLAQALYEQLQPGTVNWGTSLTGVDEPSQQLVLDNGTTQRFDFLIGADGRNGMSRQLVDPDRQPTPAGHVVFSGVTSRTLHELQEPWMQETQVPGLLCYYSELTDGSGIEWHILAGVPNESLVRTTGTNFPGAHRPSGTYPQVAEKWVREVLAPTLGPNVVDIVNATEEFGLTIAADIANPASVRYELAGRPVALIGDALGQHQIVTSSGAAAAIHQAISVAEAIGPPGRSTRKQLQLLDKTQTLTLWASNEKADAGRELNRDFALDGSTWPNGTTPPFAAEQLDLP